MKIKQKLNKIVYVENACKTILWFENKFQQNVNIYLYMIQLNAVKPQTFSLIFYIEFNCLLDFCSC